MWTIVCLVLGILNLYLYHITGTVALLMISSCFIGGEIILLIGYIFNYIIDKNNKRK